MTNFGNTDETYALELARKEIAEEDQILRANI